jgi:hypothetical protein
LPFAGVSLDYYKEEKQEVEAEKPAEEIFED